ncbi:MAG: glycosyltransferase family 4 protein [Cryomorphaceae bacterium]|nr:MAG: glycosyltransferase family 4 protein [Cryomorphaceae bacterium]
MRIFRRMQAHDAHILIIPKWYPHPADPQNGSFIRSYARALAQEQLVSVVFPVPENEPGAIRTEGNGNLLEVQVPYASSQLGWLPLRKLMNFLRYYKALMRGAGLVREQRGKPHLIHAQVTIRAVWFSRLLSRKWSIPWMLTEHSSEFLDEKPYARQPLKRMINKKLISEAGQVTAVSQALAGGLHKLSGRMDIHVIPNLIVFPELQPQPSTDEVIQVAMVGDLVDEVKNFSGALRALAAIRPECKPFHFHLVGDGPDCSKLKALAASLKISDLCTFHGRMEHAAVLKFLPTIDFLVTNSYKETFSMVSAEAIAAGKPVVVTRCGGPEEWFAPSYGLMVEPGNDSELPSALLKMMSNYQNYPPEKLGENIRKQFSANEVLSAYRNCYQNLLNH